MAEARRIGDVMRAWKFALVLAGAVQIPSASQSADPAPWVRTWAAVPVQIAPDQASPPLLPNADVTFRMIAHASAPGSLLRLRLSNEMGASPLALGSVHVAIAGKDKTILPGSDRIVTFNGIERPVIPAGAPIVSDPVKLAVPAMGDIVVSIHVPGDARGLTVHMGAHATTQIVAGDKTAAPALAGSMTTTMRYLLTGVDVLAGPGSSTIVAFGDSITDGTKSTDDANLRWPDLLSVRLAAKGRPSLTRAPVTMRKTAMLPAVRSMTGSGHREISTELSISTVRSPILPIPPRSIPGTTAVISCIRTMPVIAEWPT
jgi:hypothetical protein